MDVARAMIEPAKSSAFGEMNTHTSHRNSLILVTDTHPDLNGSGSQHLRDVIDCFNKYSLLKIIHVNTESVDYHRSNPPADDGQSLEASSCQQHITQQLLFENTVFSDAEQIAYLHRIRVNAYTFFDKFNRELDAVRKCSTVVIFVQWPGMIFLWEAFTSSKWLTVPILMDRYEPLFISFPLASSSKALIHDSFNAALLKSDGLLVGSKKAAKALSKKLQVPCREILSVFREISAPRIVDREYVLAGLRRLKTPQDSFNRIAFAGQIYAKDTTEMFLSALERLNSMSNTVDSRYLVDYYGEYPIQNMYDYSCIEAHESLEYKELMATLSTTCSFGLVPYSFDELFASSAEFSFPSKLVAYIQAGLIPIYIGPKCSSIFELFVEYDLTRLCITEPDVDHICQSLKSLFLSDHDAIRLKLFDLSRIFNPEYLQHCINSVFDQVS